MLKLQKPDGITVVVLRPTQVVALVELNAAETMLVLPGHATIVSGTIDKVSEQLAEFVGDPEPLPKPKIKRVKAAKDAAGKAGDANGTGDEPGNDDDPDDLKGSL